MPVVPLANERRIPCGFCKEPVLESHFRAGSAKMFQGVLYCVVCSKKAEEARTETIAFKQSLSAGTFYQCAKCDANVPLADIRSGAVVYYLGELSCRACARDLKSLLGPRSPSRDSQRLPHIGDLDGATAEPQHSTCSLCAGPVSARSVREGRALIHEGLSYCAQCRPEVEELLDVSRVSCQRLIAFSCSTCANPIPPEDLLEDKALRYRGQLFCRSCAQDMGHSRSSGEVEVREPGRRTAVVEVDVQPLSVPCARCDRTIPPLDVRTGKTLEVNGKLYCRRCKEAHDEAKRKIEHRAARSLVCAHCGRSISAREVSEHKAVYNAGNLYCTRCAKDPGIVLHGTTSSYEVDLTSNLCGTCGAPATRNGQCARCAEEIQLVRAKSAGATDELESLLEAVPCEGEGCAKGVTIDDLEHGLAEIVGNKTLCLDCAGKERARRPKRAAARCARCDAALSLDTSHAPGALCERCIVSSQHDAEETEAALSLSGEVSLACGTCGKTVTPAELSSGQAATIDGRLLCRGCKTRVKAAPPARSVSLAKPCMACDGKIKGEPLFHNGRPLCMPCKLEVDALLKQGGALPPKASCTACKKPAPAAGALLIGQSVFCGSCKKAADYFLLYTVRQRRGKPKRPARPLPTKSLAVVGFAVLFCVGGWGFVTTRAPESPAVSLAPPAPSAAELALQDVLKAGLAAPATFEQARKLVAAVQGVDAAAFQGDTRYQQCLQRVLRWRDDFAPGISAKLVDAATVAFRKAGRPEDSIQALIDFPKDLEGTPAFAQVVAARERWSALAACMRQARSLLASSDPPVEALQRVLFSPEAQRCDFAKTDLGKQVETEWRRLKNHLVAQVETAAPSDGSSSASQDDLARAYAFEQKNEPAPAEVLYKAALTKDRDSAVALLGLARTALERERLDAALSSAVRALVLGRDLAGAGAVDAWIKHLEGDDTSAKRILSNIAPKQLGRLGRRLKPLLEVPRLYKSGHVRVYVDAGVPKGALDASLKPLGQTSALVAEALDLAGTEQLDLYCFPDEESRKKFVEKLEARPEQNGHVPGTFAVVLVAPVAEPDLLRAIGAALASRAETAPAWLVAALPEELAGAPLAPGGSKMSLVELERLTPSAVLGRPDALASARAFAGLAQTLEGARSLGAYLRALQKAKKGGDDAAKATEARKALETALARSRR